MSNSTMVAALLRERSAYVSRDDADRVAQVDAQLEHYGYQAPAAETDAPPVTDPDGGPVDRSASGGQQTAEGAARARGRTKTSRDSASTAAGE